jgi:hypothetical protein
MFDVVELESGQTREQFAERFGAFDARELRTEAMMNPATE